VAERESRVRIRLREEELQAARERDRLLEEERRRREEEARLEGIRAAEVARVRDEVARRAELERAMSAREHELRLATLRQAASSHATRIALLATGAATLAAGVALVWLELSVHPKQMAALQVEYASRTASERARADRAEGLLKTSEAARRGLEAALRAREAVPPPAATTAPSPRSPPTRVPFRGPRTGGKEPPCVDDHDPLNPCLSR
jgi:hypothetical protein